MKPSSTSIIRHNSHASGEVSLNTQRTLQKRKRSEADLEPEDITLNNPIWAAAVKGKIGLHIHTSKTALQLVDGLDGALSKDMARVYLTVHALRGAIQEFEIRKREQNGHLKPDHHKDMVNLKRRLVAAERRERRQKSKEEKALERILKGFQAPNIANSKRPKLSGSDFNMSNLKPKAGPIDKACRGDSVKMIGEASHSQCKADTTEAHELLEILQQEAAGAISAKRAAATTMRNDPDSQAQSSAKSHPRDGQAEKSREEPATPESPWFSLEDLQAKIKSDEDELVQKYREKPKGMSLSAWCTQQGLPKQRPAGRDPFPIKNHGNKRNRGAMGTGFFDIEKPTKTNNKRQKLETSVTEQLPPVQRKGSKLKVSSPGDLLRRQSFKNAISKRIPPHYNNSGTTPSRAGGSRQETDAVDAAIKLSLVHGEPDVTHEIAISTIKSEYLARSSSSPPIEKESPELSFAELTASRRLNGFTFNKPSGGNLQAANAMPNAMKPLSAGTMQTVSSQHRPPPIAEIDHNSPFWKSDEDTMCKDELEIPSIGTKGYDCYVDSRLEEYRAEKEIKAKQAKEVDKTPSEDPKRTKPSEALMAYTASLRAYGQDQKRRFTIHKKNIEDLTEEEFAIKSARFPARPVLPPMVGHEIAAKVHLEGTWSHAKHRFQFPAKPNGKIEPIWKSPESRPPPPNPRSSANYQKLRGRELFKMGPKRARTKYVPHTQFHSPPAQSIKRPTKAGASNLIEGV